MFRKSELRIESYNVSGCGAVILTGPSGCGKGEIANCLVKTFNLNKEFHLSMGEILRSIINKARTEKDFLQKLQNKYHISNEISIFDENNNDEKVLSKAKEHKERLAVYLNEDPFFTEKKKFTQFVWLNYAVNNGLLVPNEWTFKILEATFEENEKLRNSIFLIDGYPRTIEAARHMLDLFERVNIPVIKIIHLSITKREMIRRAKLRKRLDDNIESLENRFNFYIDQVQPSIDEMKMILGSDVVQLIDAHQPVFDKDGSLLLQESIENVAEDVINSLNII